MLARIVGLIGLLLLPLGSAAAQGFDFGRYHALVIGNNDYQNLPRLETAISDAAATAEILRIKYGFKVTLLLNATRADILSQINQFRATLTPKDRFLIYYAGHGELDKETGTGYWLPVDAEPQDDTNWIANEALTRHFKAMSAKHVMVVADSCYSGALVRSASAAPVSGSERSEWIQRMASKRSRTALVSGGLEPVTDEGSGGHSVFANAFLRTLRENNGVLEGQELAKRVSMEVVLNADQTPEYSDMRKAGHDGGDFLFVPTGLMVKTVEPTAGTGVAVDERTMELAFWNSIKESNGPAPFEAYLEQYPAGAFAPLARVRIAELKGKGWPLVESVAAPPPAEQKTAMLTPQEPAHEIDEVDALFFVVKNANMRRGPSAGTEKLGTLRSGTTVAVTGKVRGADWYRVMDDSGVSGFVYGPLLSENEAAPAAPQGGGAADVALWNSVRESDNPNMVQAYLTRFPDGTFAELAAARIGELKSASKMQGAGQRTALLTPAALTPATTSADIPQGARVYNVQPFADRSGRDLTYLTDIIRDTLAAEPDWWVVTAPRDVPGYDMLVTSRVTKYTARQEVNEELQGALVAAQIFGAITGIRTTQQGTPMLMVHDAEVTITARDPRTNTVIKETGIATLKLDPTVHQADARGNALQIATTEAVNRLVARLAGREPAPRPVEDHSGDGGGQEESDMPGYSRDEIRRMR